MDTLDRFDCAGMIDEPFVKALRAAVELHKPIVDYWYGSSFPDLCDECSVDEYKYLYPCDTIKAIKKALQ